MGGVGAFGKMPGMGDFLRLNVSARFVQVWDGWLQGAMLAARNSLGDRWNECYLSAPIWRFSLPRLSEDLPGVSGIMMPSVDRVGRQYPLTLAVPVPTGPSALRHFANDLFFSQLEAIALMALDQDLDRAALEQHLAPVALTAPPHIDMDPQTYAGKIPVEAILAGRSLDRAHGPSGIWTSSAQNDHRMFLTRDLPNEDQALALFDANATIWRNSAVAVPA